MIRNSHMRINAHSPSELPARKRTYTEVTAQSMQNINPEHSDQRKERSIFGNFTFALIMLFVLHSSIR